MMAYSTGPVTRYKPDSRIKWALLSSIAITVAVYVLPYGRTIGYPLVLLSTFVHEMGHGIAALLMGGNFHQFHLWEDGSGAAHISGNLSRFARGFVAAGGLVGPALGAAVCFATGRSATLSRILLVLLGFAGVMCDLLLVRNAFGLVFVGLLAMSCLGIALKAPAWVSQTLLLLFAVQLALSVFSRGDYLFTDVAHTAGGPAPSDVAQMADAWLLPYWFWGAICGLFSLLCLWVGLQLLLRPTKRLSQKDGANF